MGKELERTNLGKVSKTSPRCKQCLISVSCPNPVRGVPRTEVRVSHIQFQKVQFEPTSRGYPDPE